MRITRVQAQNLKGRTFDYELEREVAIEGENFTGKTSIIDAIRLALIGYIPELGKLPKATRQLMSDEFMSVHLEFDTGAVADVEINGENTRSCPVKFEFDGGGAIPLLNAAAYFGMSERERYQYVFQIAKTPEAFTAAAVCDDLRSGIHFEQSGTEEAKKRMISFVADAFVSRTIQEGLQAAIDVMAERFKYYNSRSKDTQGAVRVLTELKNRQSAMAGNVKQFEEAERCAQADAHHAFKALQELRQRALEVTRYNERKMRHDELQKITQTTEDTDKLEALIKEATAQLSPKVESQYSQADVEAFRWAHSEVLGKFNEYSIKLAELKHERKVLEAEFECPHCGSKGKGWKDRLRATLDEQILRYVGLKAAASTTVVERKEELEKAEAEVKQVAEHLAYNKLTNEKIVGWQARIDTQLRRRNEWKEALAKEDLSVVPEPVTKEQLDKAEAENIAAEATYKTARQLLKEAELLEQDVKRAAQSQQEHETAVAHVVVIKEVGKLLREKQAALVEKVFGDLLHVANGIVGEIMASDLAFHDGEVGRWDDHRWISHKTFSGTEQALTFVAIAAALSQGAPIRLLIFDELGRLDKARRALLLNVLRRALEDGWLDQWIVAGTPDSLPSDTELAAAGIQLIDLDNP